MAVKKRDVLGEGTLTRTDLAVVRMAEEYIDGEIGKKLGGTYHSYHVTIELADLASKMGLSDVPRSVLNEIKRRYRKVEWVVKEHDGGKDCGPFLEFE